MSKQIEAKDGQPTGVPDRFSEWLGAYLDGELSADRRVWIENHLKTCPSCQYELEELRALSGLLQSDPLPESTLSSQAFSEEVIRQLPRQNIIWPFLSQRRVRLIPLGLFSIWAFCQAVIWVSGGLFLALRFFPFAEQVARLVLPFANFAANNAPFSGPSNGGLSSLWSVVGPMVQNNPVIGPLTWLNLFLAGLLALAFLIWLVSLVVNHQPVKHTIES